MILPPDDVEPSTAAEAAQQAIRTQLQWRINSVSHPSHQINQTVLADQRCRVSIRELARLIGRAPKVLKMIRAQLRNEFDIEPDSLLFTEPQTPTEAQKVDSLTDRALWLLLEPFVPINVNHYITLSVQGEPNRRLPYKAMEVFQRVSALQLLGRLSATVNDYWDTLVPGSWRTRRERWGELHAGLFADRAFLARQLDELSAGAMAMLQAVIDAPTVEARQRAGGEWASVHVAQLMWPGAPPVAIPGALHVYREGEPHDAPHVIYLPGVTPAFWEYPSFVAFQCGILALGRSRFDELWQCLPLNRRHGLCRPDDLSPTSSVLRGRLITGHALEQGAQALLEGQWSNELACTVTINYAHVFSTVRPTPQPLTAAPFLAFVERARRQLVGRARLGKLGDQLLKWDHQRRRDEIIFASTASGLALLTAGHQVKRYEKGLLALLAADDLSADTPAHQALLAQLSQLTTHTQALEALLRDAQPKLLQLFFWTERPGGAGTPRRISLFLKAQAEALRCEAHIQHQLKLLSTAHRDLIIEVVDQPLARKRLGSQTQVMSVAVGSEPDAFYSLHNLWIVTTAAAKRVPSRQLPVVLYVFGLEGGVLGFSGMDALTRSLRASLSSLDDSVLWGNVERDKRRDLRGHALRGTLGIRFVDITAKPALATLKKVLGTHHRLINSTEDITRIFSEVKDSGLSRALLGVELEQKLRFPTNAALSEAQANIEHLRKAALAAKKLRAVLTGATGEQRKTIMHSQRLYLRSAFAYTRRLEQYLPDLETFARRTLIARLKLDGFYPPFDIDRPLLEMPDDVQSNLCGGASDCTAGDPRAKYIPTYSRTTFSLLQLALHNLDPLAPWTKWRFELARFLQPEWRQQLTDEYLIGLVSSLDIGGQYDALINSTFYPRAGASHTLSEGRIPELLNRTLEAGIEHHAALAMQQGLTAQARSVFSTAMAARAPLDLLKNQHQLQLYGVHLVGHTMQHDRAIAGIVAVHDNLSGLCVVYWPEAAPGLVLTEYTSLQQAQAELNRVWALPDNAKALARQVAPGWAFGSSDALSDPLAYLSPLGDMSALVLFKGIWRGIEFVRSFQIKHLEPTPLPDEIEKLMLEQIATDSTGWLALVGSSHCNPVALLYRASVLDLQRRTQAASRSAKALQHYRTLRLKEQADTANRAVVGFFFPLFGILNDVHELLLLARNYHRFGDPIDAIDIGFMTASIVVDLFLGLAGSLVKTGGAVRASPRSMLGRVHRATMMARNVSPFVSRLIMKRLTALVRFHIKGIPEHAVALKGLEARGVFVKNGETFVADSTHHCPVYRRSNEQLFRLQNKQTPGENELILNIHQSEERLLGADAPQPEAGTSSGVLNPWRAPARVTADWWPPLVRTTTESNILQSTTQATHWRGWQGWRVQIMVTNQFESPAPGVFHIPVDSRGFSYHVLRLAPGGGSLTDPSNEFYRLLPKGNEALWNRIVFITQNEQLVSLARVDIERWTSTDLHEQPLPASRTPSNEWRFHAPLFDKPLTQYVAEAFPAMTIESRAFTVARMIELSGPERPATASHLLGLRATLDNWLPPSPARHGQTDDLLRMLRPTQRGQTSVFIGYQGAAPGFTRVDFVPSFPLDPALQRGPRSDARGRDQAQRRAVNSLLEGQGFTVISFEVRRQRARVHEAILTHPNSPGQLYYLSNQWFERSSAVVGLKLTNKSASAAIVSLRHTNLSVQLSSALQDQRLARILAGIQWPINGNLPATVYFIKLTP